MPLFNSFTQSPATYRAIPRLADNPGESIPIKLMSGGDERPSRIAKSDLPVPSTNLGRKPEYAH